jgi:hypothetical protein
MIRAFVIGALLALTAGCFSSDYNAKLFHPWGCDNAKELKARLDEYKDVLMVCIYEDHWEDRGPNRYSLHHYTGTVVKVYKGDWRMSARIAFMEGLDYRAPVKPASCVGDLEFVFASEHTNTEIGLDRGELWTCKAEYAPALDRVYPRNLSP